MLQDSKLKSAKKRKAHLLTNGYDYLDDLARWGRFTTIPELYKNGFKAWGSFSEDHLANYKDHNLKIEADNKTVRVVKP